MSSNTDNGKPSKQITINLFKHLRKVDFRSPEVLKRLDIIHQEIDEILLSQKPDPEKMKIIFSVQEFASDFVKNHTPVGFIYKDFFMAGMIAALLLSNTNKESK